MPCAARGAFWTGWEWGSGSPPGRKLLGFIWAASSSLHLRGAVLRGAVPELLSRWDHLMPRTIWKPRPS
eukprot:14774673-Alexandrium_andersonii.AAC.1